MAKATTDHDKIQSWTEKRGGHPARVKATGSGDDPGILRIDFPGYSGEDTLEEISWDEFFEWFDRNKLAMLLSDEKNNRFNKLVARKTVKSSSSKKAPRSVMAKRKAGAAKKRAASSGQRAGAKKSSAKKASAKKAPAKKKPAAKKAAAKKKPAATKKSPAKKRARR